MCRLNSRLNLTNWGYFGAKLCHGGTVNCTFLSICVVYFVGAEPYAVSQQQSVLHTRRATCIGTAWAG